MKKLLQKTTRPFLIYILIVLAISIPVYFYVVDTIWLYELDEHNEIIADKTTYRLNMLNMSPEEMDRSITLWNKIQPGTNLEKVDTGSKEESKTYTIEKQKEYSETYNIDRFRCLSKIIYIHQQPYRFTIETNVEETEETIAAIALITLFFLILLVIGILVLNRRISKKIWTPFQDSLQQIKSFKLYNQTSIQFKPTDIAEFEELNTVLKKLIDHTIIIYQSQKEFTENASHELQTPLAILKTKLDNFLQKETLTDRQYTIVEEMHKTLTRSARINKTLLLLAKIENHQFDHTENTAMSILVEQCLTELREHFELKNIHLETKISAAISLNCNKNLAETMINNLLLNAIRYTAEADDIFVMLTGEGFEIRNTGNRELNKATMFQRFSKSSANQNGSGLGLALVKQICEIHGWEIRYSFEEKQHIFSIRF